MRHCLHGAAAAAALLLPIAAHAGPITGYPAATTPLSGSEAVIGTQSGTTVQITTASIAQILLSATSAWTAVQTFPTPGASKGSLVLTPGSLTGTPPDGSLWTTTSGLFFQINGVSHQAVGNGPNSWTGEQSFAASGAAGAGVNLGAGAAPTSPLNGDLWATSSGVFARLAGATHQFADLDANTFTGEQVVPASTLANAGLNLGQGQGPTTPVNGDLWITSSGVFAEVNGAIASLGVTVPTAAAGGANSLVQYNCSSVLCGATGYSYSSSSDTLTGPDSTTWKTAGLTLGQNLNINTHAIVSGSTPIIWSPSCEGATWLIGPDTGFCNHATTGGTDNIGIGTIVYGALTTGFGNVAMGSEDNRNLTTGSNNTSIGFEAGHLVTTGTANTGIGSAALDFVTTGNSNVAAGQSAGSGISTGSFNVCIYTSCGANNTMTGNNNVIVGGGGALLTSGARNIFMGPTNNSAGYGIVTGTGNVYIGGQTTLTDQSDSITLADGDSHTLLQYLTGNGYAEISYPVKIDGKYIRLSTTTVSGLATADSSPGAGDQAFVTDATSCTFNSSVIGGGSTKCPVVYNGTAWVAG